MYEMNKLLCVVFRCRYRSCHNMKPLTYNYNEKELHRENTALCSKVTTIQEELTVVKQQNKIHANRINNLITSTVNREVYEIQDRLIGMLSDQLARKNRKYIINSKKKLICSSVPFLLLVFCF